MQECPTCETVYCIVQDDDPPFIRTLCDCEAVRMCQSKKCNRRAAQAYLQADGATVSSYRCVEHGQDVFAVTYCSMIRSNTPKMESLSDEMLYSTLEGQLKKEAIDKTTQLRCTFCKTEHTPEKRKWIRSHENGRRCLSSTCPKCKYTGYAAVI